MLYIPVPEVDLVLFLHDCWTPLDPDPHVCPEPNPSNDPKRSRTPFVNQLRLKGSKELKASQLMTCIGEGRYHL